MDSFRAGILLRCAGYRTGGMPGFRTALVIAGLYSRRFLSDPAHVMLATGFLGGFSTFSTMMNESVTLLRGGRITVFVGYVLTSVVVPVMAAALGYCLVV